MYINIILSICIKVLRVENFPKKAIEITAKYFLKGIYHKEMKNGRENNSKTIDKQIVNDAIDLRKNTIEKEYSRNKI